MRIACYVNRWSREQFRYIARGIDANATLLPFSTHKAIDESGVSERYYRHLGETMVEDTPASEQEDFIQRCRVLRSISRPEAVRHLGSVRQAISWFLDYRAPDIVLGETVDSFIVDVVRSECNKRRIPFVGLVKSFLNGYIRLTARGEAHSLRQPASEEISNVLSMLEQPAYAPSFLRVGKARIRHAAVQRWIGNALRIPFFWVRRRISGDKFNDNHWSSELMARLYLRAVPSFRVGSSDWRDSLRSHRTPLIYVPLQYVPEATVDYWCDNLAAVEYEETLVAVLTRLTSTCQFVVKEHPNMLGLRNPQLYERLARIGSVAICPTEERSNDVVATADAVMVWTGSSAFEAALRGKPIISMCRPYYAGGIPEDRFMSITPLTSADSVSTFVQERRHDVTSVEKQEMVRHLLSGLLPNKSEFSWSWSAKDSACTAEAMKLGSQIAEVLPRY